MGTLERIKAADAVRLVDMVLKLGADEIPVRVRLLSIDEFDQALEVVGSGNSKKVVAMLAEQFVDPETGSRLFAPDDLRRMTRTAFDRVLDLFIRANRGDDEKKSCPPERWRCMKLRNCSAARSRNFSGASHTGSFRTGCCISTANSGSGKRSNTILPS